MMSEALVHTSFRRDTFDPPGVSYLQADEWSFGSHILSTYCLSQPAFAAGHMTLSPPLQGSIRFLDDPLPTSWYNQLLHWHHLAKLLNGNYWAYLVPIKTHKHILLGPCYTPVDFMNPSNFIREHEIFINFFLA